MGTACWEFMKCGRERDGLCPTVILRAGDHCWRVAGAICHGLIRGDNARVISDCAECPFFKIASALEEAAVH